VRSAIEMDICNTIQKACRHKKDVISPGVLAALVLVLLQLGLTYFVATDFDTIDAVRVQLTTQTCAPGTQAPTMPPMSPTAVGGSTQAPQTAPDIG